MSTLRRVAVPLVLFALVGFFAAVLARPVIPEDPGMAPEGPGTDESSAP